MRVGDKDERGYTFTWATYQPRRLGIGMTCDDCKVFWTGCWDNFECPKCGKGELPSCGDQNDDFSIPAFNT